jgi:hypothetical protein
MPAKTHRVGQRVHPGGQPAPTRTDKNKKQTDKNKNKTDKTESVN